MTEKHTIANLSSQPATDNLQSLVERLKPLDLILAQNSYVRDVTRRLERLIEDAESQPMLLILGKERVGKTSLINSLIERQLLSVHQSNPTNANTFIRYGEQECVKTIFLDGMVATFDISKLELLTSSDNFGAQIIREHLDYLEVYVKHDLLKEVTIVDTIALEMGAENTAYFSHALIDRADEIFWVLRNGSPATEAEVNLLHKLAKRNRKPSLIVNAVDEDGEYRQFIEAEKARYGELIDHTLGVSASKAMEARKTNDTQLLIDSRYTELTQLIKKVIGNQSKKTRHITERLIHWLERLRKEVEIIPQREPYLSAYESVILQHTDSNYEFSRQQRDMAIIAAYEDEYKKVCQVFKPVQTLYQLLQVLASDLYLRDDAVEGFESVAIHYQELVRDYRKIHSDYVRQYELLNKQFKKVYGREAKNPIQFMEDDAFTADRVTMLNDLQQTLAEKKAAIQQSEQQVLSDLYMIQNRLNKLAMSRLGTIIGQVSDLNSQRKKDRLNLASHVNKLAEFTCITEAQGFLRDAIQPYMLSNHLPLSEDEQLHIRNTIECICAIDLTHEGLFNRAMTTQTQDLTSQLEFDDHYKLVGLSLTEADVVSDLPALPAAFVVETTA